MSGLRRAITSADHDEPLDGHARAIDGMLRELAYGPANNEDDETLVANIMSAIHEGGSVKVDTRYHRLPAPRRHSPVHLPAMSHAGHSSSRRQPHAASRWKTEMQWALWVPIAACFALAVGALFFSGPSDKVKVARLHEFSPGVTLARNEQVLPIQKGTEIFPSDILQVNADGWAVVKYNDDSRLEIQPSSTLIFGKPSSDVSKRVTIRSGGFNAHVAKQPGGRNLLIDTPDSVTRVLGTRLNVQVEANATRVDVEEGKVRVSKPQDNSTVDVKGGQFAVASPGVALGVRAMTVELTRGLAGHWKFDEGLFGVVTDEAGNDCSLRVFNPVWTTGRVGGAMEFNGRNAHAEVDNSAPLNLTGTVTVCAWIKLNVGGRDQKIAGIMGERGGGNGGGYKLSVYADNKLDFEIRPATGIVINRNVTGGTVLAPGVWYHVMGVYNDSENFMATYINGALERRVMTSASLSRTTGKFTVGAEPWAPGENRFNGLIDDLRVYNRALNAAEIRALCDAPPIMGEHLRTPGSELGQSDSATSVTARP
ncbi:MAG TPA: LamG-like jellyroll fold domain-containing protein [Planctomycetota bacterium]|nr:LamG-like jellyroll fold domain-containing protein [Planctomycetota bacterium]